MIWQLLDAALSITLTAALGARFPIAPLSPMAINAMASALVHVASPSLSEFILA
jgi:hypothetical protein